MPLDGTLPIDLTVLHPGKKGLRQLSYVLRHPELWPRHQWDYANLLSSKECGTVGCAIGIAGIVWGERCIWKKDWEKHFRMPSERFFSIFLGLNHHGRTARDITPQMVADKIDDYCDQPGD